MGITGCQKSSSLGGQAAKPRDAISNENYAAVAKIPFELSDSLPLLVNYILQETLFSGDTIKALLGHELNFAEHRITQEEWETLLQSVMPNHDEVNALTKTNPAKKCPQGGAKDIKRLKENQKDQILLTLDKCLLNGTPVSGKVLLENIAYQGMPYLDDQWDIKTLINLDLNLHHAMNKDQNIKGPWQVQFHSEHGLIITQLYTDQFMVNTGVDEIQLKEYKMSLEKNTATGGYKLSILGKMDSKRHGLLSVKSDPIFESPNAAGPCDGTLVIMGISATSAQPAIILVKADETCASLQVSLDADSDHLSERRTNTAWDILTKSSKQLSLYRLYKN